MLLDGLGAVVALGHEGRVRVVVLLPDLGEGAEGLGFVELLLERGAAGRGCGPVVVVVVDIEVCLATINVYLRAFNVSSDE